MIGSFAIGTHGDKTAICLLNDDGSWECDEPAYRQLLNAKFAVVGHQPYDGQFGCKQFAEAMAFLKGRVLFEPVPAPSEPGRVY